MPYKDPEVARRRARERYAANPDASREKNREKNRKYYTAHQEKLRARKRVYRLANLKSETERMRVWSAANRERISARSRANKYGMSVQQLREFLTARPVCEICGGKPVCVDHHHHTGLVRGHLCNNCNTILGFARESPGRLRAAAEYLEKHQQVLKLLG